MLEAVWMQTLSIYSQEGSSEILVVRVSPDPGRLHILTHSSYTFTVALVY